MEGSAAIGGRGLCSILLGRLFLHWPIQQPFHRMSKKAPIPGRQTLPAAFTYTQAKAAGISAERLYASRDQGLIDQVARGLYRWADAPEIDQDLLEVAHRAPLGTLCLVTALAAASPRRVGCCVEILP
jgi:hypothetical protein